MRATLIAIALVGMLAVHSVEATTGEQRNWSSYFGSKLRQLCSLQHSNPVAALQVSALLVTSPPDLSVQPNHHTVKEAKYV